MRDFTATAGWPARPDPSAIAEIDIFWLTAGLGCDGDTIAMTAATQHLGWQCLPPGRGHGRPALDGWDVSGLDFLFIENVGNLVCPSSFDLGESLRLVLISVTGGEDKPLKYPTICNSADVAVVTKMDRAASVEFDDAALERNIHSVRPGMPILQVSSKSGAGVDAFLDLLTARRVATMPDAVTAAPR